MLHSRGLVGYWPLENTAIDASGSGNDGTVTGATPTTGKLGRGYAFNYGHSIRTACQPANGILTLAIWVYPTAQSVENHIIECNPYQIRMNAGNVIRFYSGSAFTATEPTISLNVWTHLAFVGTNVGHFIYVNGRLASEAGNTNPLSAPAGGVVMGAYYGFDSYGWIGTLDEGCAWPRALSETDIRRVMLGMHPIG